MDQDVHGAGTGQTEIRATDQTHFDFGFGVNGAALCRLLRMVGKPTPIGIKPSVQIGVHDVPPILPGHFQDGFENGDARVVDK